VIVVDTNLLIYLYVEGEHTAGSEAVLRRNPLWAAPLLWRSEFRNVLTGLIRRRALRLDEAMQIASEAERGMTGREYTVLSHHVLRLAARSRCSAYDCEFVALAEDLGVPLVTTDREVLAAFPSSAVSPEGFVRNLHAHSQQKN
jgi:predicted nucleic acid-binding protein